MFDNLREARLSLWESEINFALSQLAYGLTEDLVGTKIDPLAKWAMERSPRAMPQAFDLREVKDWIDRWFKKYAASQDDLQHVENLKELYMSSDPRVRRTHGQTLSLKEAYGGSRRVLPPPPIMIETPRGLWIGDGWHRTAALWRLWEETGDEGWLKIWAYVLPDPREK